MAGLRRLHRDLGGLQVPNFPHQDDVRVLAQEGTQGGGKLHALLGVHIDLVDPLQVDLHRIFRCGNIALRGIEDVYTGVKRHGLA